MNRILSLLTCLLIIACNNQTSKNDIIDININVDDITTMDIQNCSKTRLIQNNENIIMGTITKTIVRNNICAISSNNRLHIFSMDGDFISNIGNIGRAHNEYLQLSDFWIEDDHILIYDMNSKQVLEYSLSNNELTDKYILPHIANNEFIAFRFLIPFNKGYVGKCVWNGNNGESPALAFYDDKFKMIDCIGELTLNCGLDLGYPLFQAKNEILYWNVLGNTIHSITEQLETYPKFRISFGTHNFPPRESLENDYELLELYMFDKDWKEKHAGFIAYVCQTDQELIFTYMYNNKPHFATYNFEGKQVRCWQLDCNDVILKSWGFNGEDLYIVGETESETALYKIWSVHKTRVSGHSQSEHL